jgi:hypothetical protein
MYNLLRNILGVIVRKEYKDVSQPLKKDEESGEKIPIPDITICFDTDNSKYKIENNLK